MTAINEMEDGSLSAFDVNDRIHTFHNGVSRDFYKEYSQSLPWSGVCRAYLECVLTDDDLVDASDELRGGIEEIVASASTILIIGVGVVAEVTAVAVTAGVKAKP